MPDHSKVLRKRQLDCDNAVLKQVVDTLVLGDHGMDRKGNSRDYDGDGDLEVSLKSQRVSGSIRESMHTSTQTGIQ